MSRDAGHFDFHERPCRDGVTQSDRVRGGVVRVADVADGGLAILLMQEPLPDARFIEACFIDVERFAGTVLHLRDDLLRRERHGVAVDGHGTDDGLRSARDVEDDCGAALRPYE